MANNRNNEADGGRSREATIPACVLLPAFKEAGHIGLLIAEIRTYIDDVLVIDDGSLDGTAKEAEAAGAVVLRHEVNQGKGTALQTGFHYLMKQTPACEVVVTMDADGQHRPGDLPVFLAAYRRTGIPVLLGNRMTHRENMPWVRRWTNAFMSWLISREMKQYIPDTQCGFRLFRRDVLPFLNAESHRFAAESEMLFHLADRGFRIDSVRVATVYGDEKSRIRPVRDSIRFFRMWIHYRHARRSYAGFT